MAKSSQYLNKSTQYSASLDALKKHYYYAPSMHHAYYSCFLKIQHLLFTYLDYDSERIINDYNKNKKHRAKTHTVYLNTIGYEIGKEIGTKIKDEDKIQFLDDIKKLKELREAADYTDEIIEKKHFEIAVVILERFNQLIYKLYKI